MSVTISFNERNGTMDNPVVKELRWLLFDWPMTFDQSLVVINETNSTSEEEGSWRMPTRKELQIISRDRLAGKIPLDRPVYWCGPEVDHHCAQGVAVSTGTSHLFGRNSQVLPLALVK